MDVIIRWLDGRRRTELWEPDPVEVKTMALGQMDWDNMLSGKELAKLITIPDQYRMTTEEKSNENV